MIQLTIMARLWLKEKRLFHMKIMWIIYRLRFLQDSTWKYIDYVFMLNMVPRHKLGNTFPCGACKHPVVVFMNICLIFMSINRPERGTSSSPHCVVGIKRNKSFTEHISHKPRILTMLILKDGSSNG